MPLASRDGPVPSSRGPVLVALRPPVDALFPDVGPDILLDTGMRPAAVAARLATMEAVAVAHRVMERRCVGDGPAPDQETS